MALPDSWTNKPNAIPDYLEAIKQAEAPDRFSSKFLESLGFKSTNDRKFITVLKDLGFLDADGKPTTRYFEYLDLSRSEQILASAVREAFGDLFAINKEANKLPPDQVKNKLRTLYAGSKKDNVIGFIANTFSALADCADFEAKSVDLPSATDTSEKEPKPPEQALSMETSPHAITQKGARVGLGALQYHINIVLPESRDPAVYEALFRALREHIG